MLTMVATNGGTGTSSGPFPLTFFLLDSYSASPRPRRTSVMARRSSPASASSSAVLGERARSFSGDLGPIGSD